MKSRAETLPPTGYSHVIPVPLGARGAYVPRVFGGMYATLGAFAPRALLLRQELEQFPECFTSVRDSEFLFRFELRKSLAEWWVEKVWVVPEASCPARFIKDNAVRPSLGDAKNSATLRQRDDADIVRGAVVGLVLDTPTQFCAHRGPRQDSPGLNPAPPFPRGAILAATCGYFRRQSRRVPRSGPKRPRARLQAHRH